MSGDDFGWSRLGCTVLKVILRDWMMKNIKVIVEAVFNE
jgi:vacuolar-type H+-ATPase subunit C/Vma6